MRRTVLVLATTALAGHLSPLVAQEVLKPETVTVETIAAGTPLVFVADIAIGHIVDGRMHVLNADTMQYLGLIGTGFAGQIYVPPAGDTVWVSTSYQEKLTRGKRSDYLEAYDTSTLAIKQEIPIATTRAQALNYRPLMQGSVDGRWMFIQDATPATSISVVDLKAGRQTAEVSNAGCYGIYPSAKDGWRFATMCGDGTFGSYVLAAEGSDAERKASEKIFDADDDALFLHGERDGEDWLFVSFTGNVYRVNMEGDTATLTDKFAFAADGWRPSGYQTHGYHVKSGTLFVLMHPNGAEGSHKNPGEEIWAIDMASRTVVSRSPTSTAFSVTVSQTDQPVVYALDLVNVKTLRYTSDAANGHALTLAGEGRGGEAPIQIEVQ